MEIVPRHYWKMGTYIFKLFYWQRYQMLSYTSYEYIPTLNYTTDRQCNLFWRILFLMSCLLQILLRGCRNNAVLTLHYLTSYFAFHLFLPGVTVTGSQICLILERQTKK